MSKDLLDQEILAGDYLNHRLYRVDDPEYPFSTGGIKIAELEDLDDPNIDIDAFVIGGNPAGNTNVGRDGTYIVNRSTFTRNNITWLWKSGLMRKGSFLLFSNIYSRISPSFADIAEAHDFERKSNYSQLKFLKNMATKTSCPILTQFGTPWKDGGIRWNGTKLSKDQKEDIKNHVFRVCKELFGVVQQKQIGNQLPRKIVAPWGLSKDGIPMHMQGRRDKGGLRFDVAKEIIFNANHFLSLGKFNMHGYPEPEFATLEPFFV